MPLPKAPTKPATKLKATEPTLRSTDIPAPKATSQNKPQATALPKILSATSQPQAIAPALEHAAQTLKTASRKKPSSIEATPSAPPHLPSIDSKPSDASKPAKPGVATTDQASSPAKRVTTRSATLINDSVRKLFVLDTNVLMHDPSALFRFEEHDVYLPLITLEELDNHKKGMTEVARHARQVSRSLDQLLETNYSEGRAIQEGIPLLVAAQRERPGGRLFVQTEQIAGALPSSLPVGKADNQILSVVSALATRHAPRPVVLVSKDINMRIKARALGLQAEDYFNDQVLEDTDLLYAGTLNLPEDFWDKHGKGVESWQQNGTTFYRITGPQVAQMQVNQFVVCEAGNPLIAQVREIEGRTAVLQTLKDYSHHKNAVWGVTARNREQNFALNLLLNPEIDFVSLLGQAGTGKTLLTLAAGLSQVLESRRYSEIIVTRATVPVGEDIGFLPGTEEEKMAPWMGALEDNLEVLNQPDPASGEWGRGATMDLLRTKIRIKSMNFMRGRTFVNKFLIIDEAQNLTPKQMKTLITRAGPGTKVICLGNIAQIDTPYLTEGSSGLTFVVDRFKGWPHAGHITLQRGERSRLADFAAEIL